MALERPNFKLVKKVNGLEIRAYENYQIAVCEIDNNQDLNRAANAGFRYLFNYISGENQPAQKISMTVPVQQEPTKTGWKISFVVPSKFMFEQVPTPTNSRVSVEKIEAGTFACLKYRGLWNSARYEQQSQELLTRMQELNLEPEGSVTAAVYNPPLTPPMFRHNEVMVRIKGK
jgi:DNA gyrase inhibitor GyrI